MATRLKPSRINVDNTPRVGDGAAYQNDNDFHWSEGGGDMSYEDFEWVTLTGNSLVIEKISNNVTPTGNFTVTAGTLRPGIEYVLRVNTGNTPYTMTLGTGVTNPNGYSTELAPNKVNQFKFIATSDSQLELEGVDTSDFVTLGTQQTITAKKTFNVEPELGTAKTTDATNNGTKFATEAQVYLKADATDVNTKTFYLSSTSDLTNAQAAYDWYLAGKNALIVLSNKTYIFTTVISGVGVVFVSAEVSSSVVGNTFSQSEQPFLLLAVSSDTVTAITASSNNNIDYLSPRIDYATPYTPQYPGSPATKKYVDDNMTTKLFTLPSDVTTAEALATAQEAYDWYIAGNIPVIKRGSAYYYVVRPESSADYDTELAFYQGRTHANDSLNTGVTNLYSQRMLLSISDGNVVRIVASTPAFKSVLATGVDYTTPYTPEYDGSPATKKYVDDNKTEYNAGEGIEIGSITKNGRQGPAPDGFHVPSKDEWEGVQSIMYNLHLAFEYGWTINLHIPLSGQRAYSDTSISYQNNKGIYWTSSPSNPFFSYIINITSDGGMFDELYRANGCPIRGFKDSYVTPTSSWTVVQGTLGSAGIFWNQTDGIISITSDGSTGYTIMDKNLGATTVYNYGDTLSEANMGYMYQWGNNYGFQSTGTISNTSSTQVDASNYGPTNPYSSDTFIIGNMDWSSVQNDDLWGDTTGTYTLDNVITNTGVLSVNGQTGDATLDADDISDSTTTNKFVTATDKTTWSGKQDALTLPATPTQGNLMVWGANNKAFGDGGAVPTGVPSGGNNGDVLTNVSGTPTWQAPSGVTKSSIQVTLTTAGWSSNTQTVSATGVTATNDVIVSPAPANISDYADNGVYCYSQGSGTLTFKCGTVPSGSITVNVLIFN